MADGEADLVFSPVGEFDTSLESVDVRLKVCSSDGDFESDVDCVGSNEPDVDGVGECENVTVGVPRESVNVAVGDSDTVKLFC